MRLRPHQEALCCTVSVCLLLFLNRKINAVALGLLWPPRAPGKEYKGTVARSVARAGLGIGLGHSTSVARAVTRAGCAWALAPHHVAFHPEWYHACFSTLKAITTQGDVCSGESTALDNALSLKGNSGSPAELGFSSAPPEGGLGSSWLKNSVFRFFGLRIAKGRD
jgi:hypothetical protein